MSSGNMGRVLGSCTRGKRGEQLGKLQVPVQRPPAGSTLARQPLWFLCPTGGNSVFSPKASPTHISLQSPLLQASNSFNTVTTQGHRLLPMQLDSPLTGTLFSLTNSYASLSSPPFDVPKLLREEEKEKYADMAREWRAAQGKDAGLSEKQVKAARLLGSFGKCWTRGRGCRARPAGALGWHRGGVRVSPGVSQQAPYLVTGAQSGVLWLRSPGRPHWKPAATGAVAFGLY